MRIAYYAPLKPPDHPVPSGDRKMARQIRRALEGAGHEVHLASRLRSRDGAGQAEIQMRLREEGFAEAEALLSAYRSSPATRPDAWLTYHLYYKAPDWIGPRVAAALGIPYTVVEASFAPKRQGGPWALGHQAVADTLQSADTIFVMTPHDRECLEPAAGPATRLVDLPPFLADVPSEAPPRQGARMPRMGPVRLVAAAMMRPGDKLASYRFLAEALSDLRDLDWSLRILGDGEARPEVEAAFAPFRGRTEFCGAIPPEDVPARLAQSDLFVWPGVGEAYGLAYLEAQSVGLPVVAQATRGVPAVVDDGATGLLTREGDPADFAGALRRLIRDRALRDTLGVRAADFVRRDRSLASAAAILDRGLRDAAGRRTRQCA
jgi:glycosyltransferase involved in cell wall biosynthesis